MKRIIILNRKINLIATGVLMVLIISGHAYGHEIHPEPGKSFIGIHINGLNPDPLASISVSHQQKISNHFTSSLPEFFQDKKQKLDSITYHHLNETGQWIGSSNSSKHIFTYDDNGNMTHYLNYRWDYDSSHFVFGWKGEYTYNANNNISQFEEYEWSRLIKQWSVINKEEYVYGTNGKKSICIHYRDGSSQWVNDSKKEYTYDFKGNLTQILSISWNFLTSQWQNTWKYEYTYDVNDKKTQEIFYDWDRSTNQWIEGLKYIYNYDDKGNLTQFITLGVLSEKEEYTYDPEGKLNVCIHCVQEGTSQCLPDVKQEFSYDRSENMVQYKRYIRNDASGWLSVYKVSYTYDSLVSFSDLNLPIPLYLFDDYYGPFYQYKLIKYFNHKLMNVIAYEGSEIHWNPYTKRTFYYSEQNITGIDKKKQIDPVIYPNPAEDYIIIDINTNNEPSVVELYESQGRMVLKQQIPQNKQIEVKYLPRGLYIFKLNNQNTVITGKIVLQ